MADPGETTKADETSTERSNSGRADPVPGAGGEADMTVPPGSEGAAAQGQTPPASVNGDEATAAAPDPGTAGAAEGIVPVAAADTGAAPDTGAIDEPGDAPVRAATDAETGSSYWLASAEAGAPTAHEASQQQQQPSAGPRPTAAPNPIAGIRTGTTPQDPAPEDEPRRPSIVPRVAAVLVMLVFAAAIGYGLAFLSAQLVGRTGSSQPAGSVASARASAVSSDMSAGPASATARATSASPAGSVAASPSVAPRSAPAASARFHVVARGETLTSIAARYGVTVGALAAANGITDPNTIYAGQRLVIPGP
jgi:LysM repeat protein